MDGEMEEQDTIAICLSLNWRFALAHTSDAQGQATPGDSESWSCDVRKHKRLFNQYFILCVKTQWGSSIQSGTPMKIFICEFMFNQACCDQLSLPGRESISLLALWLTCSVCFCCVCAALSLSFKRQRTKAIYSRSNCTRHKSMLPIQTRARKWTFHSSKENNFMFVLITS